MVPKQNDILKRNKMERDRVGNGCNSVDGEKEPHAVLRYSVSKFSGPPTVAKLWESGGEKKSRPAMYDFLFAYTFELKYKPGRELVADMLSRLPLPATKKADEAPDVRLTDPSDLDVYMIGASGVQPSRVGPVFSGQEASAESTHREIFVVWRRMAVELCRLLLVRLRS